MITWEKRIFFKRQKMMQLNYQKIKYEMMKLDLKGKNIAQINLSQHAKSIIRVIKVEPNQVNSPNPRPTS